MQFRTLVCYGRKTTKNALWEKETSTRFFLIVRCAVILPLNPMVKYIINIQESNLLLIQLQRERKGEGGEPIDPTSLSTDYEKQLDNACSRET